MNNALRASIDLLYPNTLRTANRYLRKWSVQNDTRDEWGKFRNSTTALDFTEIENDFRSALESFILVSRAWGIEVVLMTEFNRIRLDDERVRSDFIQRTSPNLYKRYVNRYARFNDVTRQLAEKYQLTLIDLDKLVPPEERYIYDPLHLTNEGSMLVGDIVAEQLAGQYDLFTLKE